MSESCKLPRNPRLTWLVDYSMKNRGIFNVNSVSRLEKVELYSTGNVGCIMQI